MVAHEEGGQPSAIVVMLACYLVPIIMFLFFQYSVELQFVVDLMYREVWRA